MRVVELVPLLVAQPQAPAADVVPADREDRAVGDGEDRRAERREDVVAVVPAAGDVAARRPEGVAVRRRPVDREDVVLRGQPGRHVRDRGPHRQPVVPRRLVAGERRPGRGQRRLGARLRGGRSPRLAGSTSSLRPGSSSGVEVGVPLDEVVVPVGCGACPDASACPITIVDPRGKPRWSASRWMTSPVTEPCHAETKPELWFVLSRMMLMLPQSPSASSRFALGAIDEPSTNRFVIPESETSADSPLALTAARSDPTVISPPKRETSRSLCARRPSRRPRSRRGS